MTSYIFNQILHVHQVLAYIKQSYLGQIAAETIET